MGIENGPATLEKSLAISLKYMQLSHGSAIKTMFTQKHALVSFIAQAVNNLYFLQQGYG